MREPDPPGRRGRGGAAARGAGSAGARPPPPFIQPSPGAEGLRRPALHGGSAGAAPQPARRARAGRGASLPPPSARRAAREPPCPTPRSTRSWTGSFRTSKVGAGRPPRRGRARGPLGADLRRDGGADGEGGPRWGALPPRPPPRARVASVEHPVRGTRGPRALAGPCARPARCRWVSFLLLLFVFAERRQSPRGFAGLPQTALARGFPLSCRSVLSLPRSPSASGPWPCGGLGEFATRPRVPPAGQPPPPHQFRSRG